MIGRKHTFCRAKRNDSSKCCSTASFAFSSFSLPINSCLTLSLSAYSLDSLSILNCFSFSSFLLSLKSNKWSKKSQNESSNDNWVKPFNSKTLLFIIIMKKLCSNLVVVQIPGTVGRHGWVTLLLPEGHFD